MSWQEYVTTLEAGTARIKYAAIYGKTGGRWAETENKASFPATEDEIMAGVKALVNQDESICGTGLKMAGHKFTCIRLEPEVLLCQGKEEGKKDMSLVFAMSERAVLIAYNPDADIKTAAVRTAVEGIKDHLKSAGF